MSVLHELPKYKEHLMQQCPFCGEKHHVLVRGGITTHDGTKLNTEVFPDMGYSFCNCKNIFYTNWENIKLGVYDESYAKRYKNADEVNKKCAKSYWQMHKKRIVENSNSGEKFLELGAVTPYIMDLAKESGFDTTGLDIIKHDFSHPMIEANFELWDGRIWFDDFSEKARFDVIWASHIFEHFQYPLDALDKCRELLEPRGLLFIAMPDPFFITWDSVYNWAHWHIREHHIMWDMDSFADECEKKGFELIYKERNTIGMTETFGDFHILLRKR